MRGFKVTSNPRKSYMHVTGYLPCATRSFPILFMREMFAVNLRVDTFKSKKLSQGFIKLTVDRALYLKDLMKIIVGV